MSSSNRPDSSSASLSTDDLRIIEDFRQLRDVADDQRDAAFYALERRLDRRLRELTMLAHAVADANVRAVEVAEETRERLGESESRASELAERAKTLRQQADALAESNVSAVLFLADAEEQLRVAERKARDVEEANRELEQKAFVDVLTGLFNHRYFKEQVALEVARAHRYGRSLSLLFVDCDHFKRLNDTLGHPVGDQVLQRLGRTLRAEVRASDVTVRVGGAPLAARYGGEEFVVMLPETPTEGAMVVADRIRARVEAEQPAVLGTAAVGIVTVSVGLASLRPGETQDSLLRRADAALYRAKTAGRNRVVADVA